MTQDAAFPSEKPIETEDNFWGTLGFRAAGCANCQKAYLVKASPDTAVLCPNCCVANLVAQPAYLRREPPELIIPFNLKAENIRITLEKFVNEVWLRPDDCNTDILVQRIQPVFFPMWLIDCNIYGIWEAEAGFTYHVKSSQEFFSHGQWQTREEIEERVRWEKRTGQISRCYENVPVPATQDYPELIRQIGAYALDTAQPFEPKWLNAAIIRIPDESDQNSWYAAQSTLDKKAAQECQQAAGAQYQRSFSLTAEYRSPNWTQLLLPVYITYYTADNGQRQQIFINGQNGKVGGVRLASQRKGWQLAGIAFGTALLLAILGALTMLITPLVPPIGIIGIILLFLALCAGVAAIIPVVYPWQWNRRQLPLKISRSE
ncbi:MAG: hypothetical protein HPY45_03520 [Anaerolineae bacterium]|nr:hypothetical protein [Anaerolineae bacterium]